MEEEVLMATRRFKEKSGFKAIQYDGTNDSEIAKAVGSRLDAHRHPGESNERLNYFYFGPDAKQVNVSDFVFKRDGIWEVATEADFLDEFEEC